MEDKKIKKPYKRYHEFRLRADRNTFSWEALVEFAQQNGNSINEEINYAIQEKLVRAKSKTKKS